MYISGKKQLVPELELGSCLYIYDFEEFFSDHFFRIKLSVNYFFINLGI